MSNFTVHLHLKQVVFHYSVGTHGFLHCVFGNPLGLRPLQSISSAYMASLISIPIRRFIQPFVSLIFSVAIWREFGEPQLKRAWMFCLSKVINAGSPVSVESLLSAQPLPPPHSTKQTGRYGRATRQSCFNSHYQSE